MPISEQINELEKQTIYYISKLAHKNAYIVARVFR